MPGPSRACTMGPTTPSQKARLSASPGGSGPPDLALVVRLEARTAGGRRGSGPQDFALVVRLDDVAGLEVLEIRQADAALVAGLHLADVVLEAPQRGDGALPDDRALAKEPDLGAAGDRAVLHV